MTALRARVLSVPALVALVIVVALGVFVVPRLVDDSDDDGETPADRAFAAVCRDRGGTPTLAPGSGDYVKDAHSCEVRYGAHTYEMYAVTPEGFDRREAARARTACLRQIADDREQEGTPGARRHVWHPRTAICADEP